ncbi:killer cell lectin-like receptor subfamily F member 1 isoform 2-T2 [Acanthopagrus schlegelii]
MEEEEVNYASVVFKANKNPTAEAKNTEETVYDQVKVKNEPTKQTEDTKAHEKANNRDGHFRQLACCVGILCVVLLLAIIGVCVYKNQKLETQNQQLETQKKNLTDMLEDMETQWNELNVSRAQWSIDQYCPIEGAARQCKSCQAGWLQYESSCYAINDAIGTKQKTWAGAQADCKEKISDLAVINNAKEKQYISRNSWYSRHISGYWIGLRVVDGKWTWVDGSNLTDISWIQPATPTEGHCAISVQNQGLKSVNCSEMNAWICEKKALSLTPP